jgi:hypothetical protein
MNSQRLVTIAILTGRFSDAMERIQLYRLLLSLQATPPNCDAIWQISTSLQWEGLFSELQMR